MDKAAFEAARKVVRAEIMRSAAMLRPEELAVTVDAALELLAALPSTGEAEPVAPVGYVTEEAVKLMLAAKRGWHYHMFAKDQTDPTASVAIYAAPPSERKVIEATDAMVEAALQAVDPDFAIAARESAPIALETARTKLRVAINAALRASGGT